MEISPKVHNLHSYFKILCIPKYVLFSSFQEETPSRTRDPARGSGLNFTANPTQGPITSWARYDRGTRPSSKMSHDENRRKVSII